MTALARVGDTTTTPISEAIATPLHARQHRTAELSDLQSSNWPPDVVDRLDEIIRLEEGWDGFRAGPIRRDVISYACQVLERVMLPDTPAPQVTPMSHEGLMLEWHMNGIDLEIEIERPGALWMSFEDHVEGIDEEVDLETDLTRLSTPIDKLTKRAIVRR